MTRPAVLVVGLDPTRVPGPWDPAPVVAAIDRGLAELAERGMDATACLVPLDGSGDPGAMVADAVAAQRWDCVVIGGGLRAEESSLELFETVIDLVHRGAPDTSIVFNAGPGSLWPAVRRGLSRR